MGSQTLRQPGWLEVLAHQVRQGNYQPDIGRLAERLLQAESAEMLGLRARR